VPGGKVDPLARSVGCAGAAIGWVGGRWEERGVGVVWCCCICDGGGGGRVCCLSMGSIWSDVLCHLGCLLGEAAGIRSLMWVVFRCEWCCGLGWAVDMHCSAVLCCVVQEGCLFAFVV
jgi:hypothetical protein